MPDDSLDELRDTLSDKHENSEAESASRGTRKGNFTIRLPDLTLNAGICIGAFLLVLALTYASYASLGGPHIHELAKHGELSTVKKFIKDHPDNLDKRDALNRTPLMVASGFRKNPENVKFLVESETTVSARDARGRTTLMWAARNERPEIIKLLLRNGAKVNRTDDHGRTALMLAARYTKNPAVIDELLEAGADTQVRDDHYNRAIDYAQNNMYLQGEEILSRLK